MLNRLRDLGVPRLLIVGFLVLVWLIAALATRLDLLRLLCDSLVRTGMNGILVLALVPMVRAGSGLNFGLPLGIVCGLAGAILAIDAGFLGWAAFWVSIACTVPLALLAGLLYAALLERVRGQEMMVGMYVGFAAVALMSIVWLVAPLSNPEVLWPLGGRGARNTVSVASVLVTDVTRWRFYEVLRLLLIWLGIALAMAAFDRTRVGAALAAVGQNERFARSAGIPVARMRRLGVLLSTVLAAIGIVVYSQAYGFLQLYKAPLLAALPAVAALLLGGASTARATVGHALLGTCLFQSLLTASLPVVNDLVQASEYKDALSNIPEVARLILGNGVILYALTRKN